LEGRGLTTKNQYGPSQSDRYTRPLSQPQTGVGSYVVTNVKGCVSRKSFRSKRARRTRRIQPRPTDRASTSHQGMSWGVKPERPTAAERAPEICPDRRLKACRSWPPNDEVERRGTSLPQNEADLSKSSTPSLAHRRRARNRSNC